MPKKRKKPRVSIRYQDDDLLTAKEVAKYLKVTEWTVYQWAQKGRVPCIRLSKRALRFRFGDVRKAMDLLTTGNEYAHIKDSARYVSKEFPG